MKSNGQLAAGISGVASCVTSELELGGLLEAKNRGVQ